MSFIFIKIEALTLILSFTTLTQCFKINAQIPDVLSNIIESYVKPYISAMQATEPIFRSTNNEVYEKIDKKIEELKPLLQDNDSLNETHTDTEDTKIIEYVPNSNKQIDTYLDSNKNQKNVRTKDTKGLKRNQRDRINKIKKALANESVSSKTKKIVMETIEKLLEDVNGTECMWKSRDNPLITFRNKMRSANITMSEWDSLKQVYMNKTPQDNLEEQTLKTFGQFHKFFSKLVNESLKLNNRYKISCHLIDMKTDSPKYVSTMRQTHKCEKFRICTMEIGEFLKDFYNTLNETTVSVFKNYAAMYVRDTTNSTDTDRVVKVISNLADTIENKVRKTFIKHLEDFKLDSDKDQNKNIKIIKEFIRNVVGTTLARVKRQLEQEMSQNSQLMNSVERDVRINLNVDLGNLKRDFLTKVCKMFSTCNGRDVKTRRGGLSNNIHLELDVFLDDDLKTDINQANHYIKKFRRSETQLNDKYFVNVTRTTLSDVTSNYWGLGSQDLSDFGVNNMTKLNTVM